MITSKYINYKHVVNLSGLHTVVLAVWCTIVSGVYYFFEWQWMLIPWLPVALIGTAEAFYVGFKNNQAYDRLWEARKIWGSIVNSSRALSSMLYAFEEKGASYIFQQEKRDIIAKRHLAWLYTFREQLLHPTEWEHIGSEHFFSKINHRRNRLIKAGFSDYDRTTLFLKKYLSEEEFKKRDEYKNFATFLIAQQSKDINSLKNEGCISEFNHMQLQQCLNLFYDFQGQAERIKKFPSPRQFASTALIFNIIFLIMLPLGLVSEFAKFGNWGIFLCIPFCVIIGWIYIVMELVGDYSENPFAGLMFDIPMLSICRSIEIDILQMMGETLENLPESISSKQGILV
ncbi:bestrophin family protein [Elizabethkingia sp. JS20170427COW]|uniref:bestrophin family protein n=1 Tax=Elizabethkingia sp. JS20170427COW TaxID=2583851 RepID=UPI0011104A65|nr:bestrophin family ion channel [Elizabethkingia sp. JS20170427COW]QCX53483.1 hypothetical protein FGE20_06920 [Elizabethkingia sp. JS20170427COW]